MAPNLEGNISEEDAPIEDTIPIILTPLIETNTFTSEVSWVSEVYIPDEADNENEISIHEEINHIPLEQNLRELLIKVTNTEDLSTVTQVKLRVISREITLQYLSIYTPALRELILDGSIVTSLRDIGTGLKNLKILKVNRCGLTCIDGVFGFENLEELYAADNGITNLAQCAFLPYIKIIDLRRNFLNETNLSYLGFCKKLEELYLEGNVGMSNSAYPKMIKDLLPNLKALDGIAVMRDQTGNNNRTPAEGAETNMLSPEATESAGNRRESEFVGFSVNFPPRVCF